MDSLIYRSQAFGSRSSESRYLASTPLAAVVDSVKLSTLEQTAKGHYLPSCRGFVISRGGHVICWHAGHTGFGPYCYSVNKGQLLIMACLCELAIHHYNEIFPTNVSWYLQRWYHANFLECSHLAVNDRTSEVTNSVISFVLSIYETALVLLHQKYVEMALQEYSLTPIYINSNLATTWWQPSEEPRRKHLCKISGRFMLSSSQSANFSLCYSIVQFDGRTV
jgi:hypothetical protein